MLPRYVTKGGWHCLKERFIKHLANAFVAHASRQDSVKEDWQIALGYLGRRLRILKRAANRFMFMPSFELLGNLRHRSQT